jgi:hypothetical protein
MGRTQRKTSKYLELYRKTFKRKIASILEFTPPGTSKEEFLLLFEQIYPDDTQSMKKHYQFYQEKNKRRRTGKLLYFPDPAQLLYDIAGAKIGAISESTWKPEHAKEKQNEALAESRLEQERRKEKYRRNNISTQEVTPTYVVDLIDKYWNEPQKLQRLYIVQECSKYKNAKTVLFFRQVLYGENDWFIKNTAFRTLQRFDEVVYLPPKGKGKRAKYNTLVDMFGCDYKDDIGKGPLDIMEEFYGNKYIQIAKDFDVFISHSIANTTLVDEIVQHLNDLGLVAFVDWKSDREDLKRSKSNQFTADVIQLRMRQSKCLLLIRTKESDSSIWVSWELGYFSALCRRVTVFEVGDDLGEEPEFISGYSKTYLKESRLHVSENESTYDFMHWLNSEGKENDMNRENIFSNNQDRSERTHSQKIQPIPFVGG